MNDVPGQEQVAKWQPVAISRSLTWLMAGTDGSIQQGEVKWCRAENQSTFTLRFRRHAFILPERMGQNRICYLMHWHAQIKTRYNWGLYKRA